REEGHDGHPGGRAVTHGARLVALATAVPPHEARQDDAKGLVARLFSGMTDAKASLLQVFENAQIECRHTCMPLEWFEHDHTFAEKNDLYVEHAVRLAAEATRGVLARAGLEPADVDHVVFVSSTGIATPSIDALLANALGFR